MTANIIIDICENLDIEVLSLAILDQNKKGTLINLLKALEILQRNDVDVINISLGILDEDNTCLWLKDSIDRELSRQKMNGVAIMCAYHNSNNNSYPASNISTIGIKRGTTNRNTFILEDANDKTDIIVNYYKTYIRSNNGTLYKEGNSYLCAKMTAIYCLYKNEPEARKLKGSFNEYVKTLNKIFNIVTQNLELSSEVIIISNLGREDELFKSIRTRYKNVYVKTTYKVCNELRSRIFNENYIVSMVEKDDNYLEEIIYNILGDDKCELIICSPMRINIMKYIDYINKRIHYIYL